MVTRMSPVGWLTGRRLRAHGTILALCLWSLYVWNIATPGLRDRNGNLKGTDFLHLYTLGSLADAHRGADLYDMNAQAALAAHRVPDAAGIRYLPLYPPQVSVFLAPLAHLSYGWALLAWWCGSAAVYGICCYACGARARTCAIMAERWLCSPQHSLLSFISSPGVKRLRLHSPASR